MDKETLMHKLKQVFAMPPSDNWGNLTLFILMWILLAILSGLIIYGILALYNYAFLPVQQGYGTVSSMYFKEGHFTTTYNAATKSPQTHWHPDAWRLVIEKDGVSGDFYLSEKEYIKYKVGQRVAMDYKLGRLWRNLFIESIEQ